MQKRVYFDYFYGRESELFSYYRIPRLLVTGSQFKDLSTDAKLLYGLLLDRMSLSAKNGWYDNNGRVYKAQFSLLQQYRIETDAQLSMLKDALQADIDTLTGQRKALYKQSRQGEEVSEQIDAINGRLRQLRQKLKLCDRIAEDTPRIKAQLQQCQQEEKEERADNTKKQRKFERGK